MQELLPIVYTPTVGEACQKFGVIWRTSQGMYFSVEDQGLYRRILDNWTQTPDIIVVTDGSRILGLGDLGSNGMGIPIGKISLYVAAGGFRPERSLPIMFDAGTNNIKYLDDPLYLGLNQKRVDDKTYYEAMDEFLMAVQDKWPNCLVQFEDFSNDHCFDLLEKYRNKLLCFNDDIQGTGAVIAAGFLNAAKIVGIPLREHKLVFLGAGSAGIGVAELIARIIALHENISVEEARKQFWLVDSQGLVTTTRGGQLAEFKKPFARTDAPKELKTLIEIIETVKPTALVGLSGQPKSFDEASIRCMAKLNATPILFALSNPTSKSECTAQDAFEFTDGRAIFASGSPFDPVTLNGKSYETGQGNNMYIFPGLGFGAVLAQSTTVSDDMIVNAAMELAQCVTESELKMRKIYPDINKIRDISARIAATVMKTAKKGGSARLDPWPEMDLVEFVKSKMYEPKYRAIDPTIVAPHKVATHAKH